VNKNISNTTVELIEEWDWEKAVPTGRPVPRNTAHKKGIAHEGVHLWVLRLKNTLELLFQHRAKFKEMYPDCLDITVGGHVPFGINVNKIQKESFEEIGISPLDDELINLGYYRYEEISDDLFHREFQQVFLCIDNRPLNEYKFIDGEVDGIFAVRINDLELLLRKDFEFYIEGFEGNAIYRKKVSRKDFHPLLFAESMKAYMKVVIQAAKEVSLNKKTNMRMPCINKSRIL
jgi:isopentenyl-diphosphate Delta-isomerase